MRNTAGKADKAAGETKPSIQIYAQKSARLFSDLVMGAERAQTSYTIISNPQLFTPLHKQRAQPPVFILCENRI